MFKKLALSILLSAVSTSAMSETQWSDMGAEEKATVIMESMVIANQCGTKIPTIVAEIGATAANIAWGSQATMNAALTATAARINFSQLPAERKLAACNSVRQAMNMFD